MSAGPLQQTLSILTQGLKAHGANFQLLAENYANKDATAKFPGGDPYRNQVMTFKSVLQKETGAHTVEVGRIYKDKTPFPMEYNPGHPAADPVTGMLKKSNVDSSMTLANLTEAHHAMRDLTTAYRMAVTSQHMIVNNILKV